MTIRAIAEKDVVLPTHDIWDCVILVGFEKKNEFVIAVLRLSKWPGLGRLVP
jgi:hypothetical protein